MDLPELQSQVITVLIMKEITTNCATETFKYSASFIPTVLFLAIYMHFMYTQELAATKKQQNICTIH